jgi:hypothetical protein
MKTTIRQYQTYLLSTVLYLSLCWNYRYVFRYVAEWMRYSYFARFDFRHTVALLVLYGGCLALMIIGGIILRYLYRLQKRQHNKLSVPQWVAFSLIGIFTIVMPVAFSDVLSPIFFTSIEMLIISIAYLVITTSYIYLSSRKN